MTNNRHLSCARLSYVLGMTPTSMSLFSGVVQTGGEKPQISQVFKSRVSRDPVLVQRLGRVSVRNGGLCWYLMGEG